MLLENYHYTLHTSSLHKQGRKENLARQKAKAHHPAYHLDLPMEGPMEDTLNIRKQCRDMDFPPHLFPFLILIGPMNYGAIEMSSKFCSAGYEFKQEVTNI